MIIKEAKWRKCSSCGTNIERISDEEYGCDECKKPIAIAVEGKRHHDYLQVTIFQNPAHSTSSYRQFCSWKCTLRNLRKVKCNYFISLPCLQFEKDAVPGQRVKDFFKAIKR